MRTHISAHFLRVSARNNDKTNLRVYLGVRFSSPLKLQVGRPLLPMSSTNSPEKIRMVAWRRCEREE